MHFTVDSLIEDPLVRTRLVAGGSGRNRQVTWAHTCEVEDPWNWLGSGDLLMTDGYSFPSDPDGQTDFVRELAQANIAGLALGEGFVAPPLTSEALRTADDLGFPILLTARSVPFVTIARLVAEANGGQGSSRASRVLRLYNILRRTQMAGAGDDLLDLCAAELRADLNVLDLKRGRQLLPSRSDIPETLRMEVLDRVARQDGKLSAFNRIKDGQVSALLVPIGTNDAAALVLRTAETREAPDLVLAQHAATIAEFEVERRAARASRVRARAAGLARDMLNGTIAPEAAVSQMAALGLGAGPWRVTAWRARTASEGHDPSSSPVVDALAFVSWPHLYAYVDDTHLVAVLHEQYEQGLDFENLGATQGVSQPFSAVSRFADAFREARWALESARQAGTDSAVYGSHGSYFMPNTVAEGELVVRRLLGTLIQYDDEHDAELVRSLQVYFEANRSWQEGAKRLDIHKQTLVYRIKKIEKLTGADLQDFGVQAELYLALRTLSLLRAE
ncbi:MULTISPECIES: PucR family transcriptional regulator [Nocardioides]|uniref:PucR family transcriptional regulator n=1 Tax=Nocardioides TaxID=1839 RepID=UPI0013EC8774|nr:MULTISPECIES: PucR family transcriptional regulator [Nocardioides]